MKTSYDGTPAGAPGRLDTALDILSRNKNYELIEAIPATEEQLLLAHTTDLISEVKHESEYYRSGRLYEVALLATGGAIRTAEIAAGGEPAFGLIRPPGHHASRSSYWGFCYFNNMAVALLSLQARGLIRSAFILDFDLHDGDGNIDILGHNPAFTIYNPHGHGDDAFLKEIKHALEESPDVDIIAASAGFDQYIECWGRNISTRAFGKIGNLMYEFAMERCEGRRFGLLEGGYNHEDLGVNILTFCEGLRGALSE
jgi:acetoin utilization deacetylase AcuC-like enzyme